MAFMVFLTWIRLVLCFKQTDTFGPMFIILGAMAMSLVKFLFIWSVIIIAFVCVSMLAFTKVDTF